MFAIIRTGGKQYRVAEQELIRIDKISGRPGDAVQFGEVLLVGGDNVLVASRPVQGAAVAGEVVEQGRGDKVGLFKKRRRKSSRRKRGHRQEFSVVRITEILTEGRKPRAKAAATETAQPKAAAAQAPQAEAASQAARAETAPHAPAAAAPAPAPPDSSAAAPLQPPPHPKPPKPTPQPHNPPPQ